MASTYRVTLAFTRLPDPALCTFAESVIEKMTGNPVYPTPVVAMAALTAAQVAFETALSSALHGGRQATAAKNEARETLVALLRQQAAYVQSIAGDDLSDLLSSGFDTTSQNRTRIALPKPVIERVTNPMTTKLGLRLGPVPTAHAYEVRLSYGNNGWEGVGVFTQARNITIPGLTPGTIYSIQARAVGGATGYSDWSDPVSHMAM